MLVRHGWKHRSAALPAIPQHTCGSAASRVRSAEPQKRGSPLTPLHRIMVLARAERWVSFCEQKWVSFNERRGADRSACSTQGISPRSQLRFPARQLQTADWLAASLAQVRSRPFHAPAAGPATAALRLLWRGDGDRPDADSTDFARRHHCATGRRGRALIM